ncbi:transposase [Paenibacillus jamilae]|uniref:Transposase n=1 Tax=Paenibacillus jamilae TaxID=114136 RepID=A0ACC5A073_9BACL|nr:MULTISPECIES: ISL3 family transposase [Paenibacillus]AJE49794.1 transposase [Paenibacillus polymyxa]AUO09054.1 ISL3 family transposase [Paenibacillus sp. lzh-N1]KTS84546.1 transposase [Paenibacillus jamilae]QOH61831.1 ISL3 family transposase [Paenibacillus polymyxa]
MDILNLSKFNILSISENEFDFLIQVVTNSPPLACPHCGCIANLYKHDSREQIYMDLPIHGKRVGLLLKRQRYRCRDCNRTFWEHLDHTIDEKRNCTKRLLSYIEKQSLKRTFVSISEDVGLHEKTIRNIFRDYINRLKETLRFETPNWLGIDEIHIIKPRCVLTNIEEHTLLDVLPNRNKETVVGYLSRLPNRGQIRYVTMDMWQPYKDAVRAILPKALIIVDKFHVVRMANQALETIRKQLREGLSPKERRGLMHDRFILLKRRIELTEMDKITLDLWTKNHPSLGTAYDLKESYFDIWECDSRQTAFLKYNEWKVKIPTELQSAFEPLTKAMKNWEQEIFAYFDHRITNAYTESLNSLVRVINRLGRGYSFEALRAKILFTEGLKKQRKPKYQRRFDSYDLREGNFPMLNMPPVGVVREPEEIILLGIDFSTLIEKLEKDQL